MGYLVAAGFMVEVLATFPTGILADSLGVKRVTVFGLLLLALGAGLASVSSGWMALGLDFFSIRSQMPPFREF